MLTGSAGETKITGGFSAFDFSARKTVVAAVSGGSDSLALLLLLKTHLEQTAPATKLAAVTVDHALRQESAAEADLMAKFCAARGIEHRILRWEGEKPRTGISAAAREARHRLLAQAAQSFGSDLVLTGHTLDDQAETVLMRRARGDGRGLAGIAPATLFNGRIWLARPLLGLSREMLRGWLREQGVEWIDDPSNADPAYERVRARREIAARADPEALKQTLVAQAAEAAAARVALGEEAADLILSHAEKISPGLVRLSLDLASVESHASRHALRLLLAAIGGRDQLPEEARAAELLEKLKQAPCRATLSGAAIDARKSGIFLHREFRGEGPAATPAADGAIWDGRFRIGRANGGAAGCLVAPLGKTRAAEAAVAENAAAPASLARAALASQPASLLGVRLTPLIAPYARFLPSFDLAPAQALAALIGAPAFPPPPFAGHIKP